MSGQPATKSDVTFVQVFLFITIIVCYVFTYMYIHSLKEKLDALEQQIQQLKK